MSTIHAFLAAEFICAYPYAFDHQRAQFDEIVNSEARAYRNARAASERAADARANLPPGSSRAKITTANARWMSAAEERDRLAALLTPEDRIAVGATTTSQPTERPC